MAKIYLSSTYSDLKEHREAVYRTLRQMSHDVIAMEDYVAADERPLDKCLADVSSCDLYIGVFAWRYGFVPPKGNPDQKSITELEYRKAEEKGKKRLIFLLNETAAWPPPLMDAVTGDGDSGALIRGIRSELGQEKLASFFETSHELAKLVSVAVREWERDTQERQSAKTKKEAPSGPPRVFISYARADGEKFALELSERLAQDESGLVRWRGRVRMEGGVGWWNQITDALDKVQFMIVVMTPSAVASEITRKEWRYARQRGVCVCSVKGSPDSELDYGSLPNWMRKAHFYDLKDEWETFVHYLKSPCSVPRAPFMAPDMPERFVPRTKELHQILNRLLDPDRKDPVAITTALHGAGGFGKTTLAIAVCHHDDAVTAFDDGILWVTLGESPNVRDGLLKLYTALTGERPAFVDDEDAAYHVAEKLKDRNCLIVIDDVWDAAHLRPFLRGGPGCARLITTRRMGIAVSADGDPVGVDEMTREESVELLCKLLIPPPKDRAPFRRLARRLGEWPLLLELANAALRHRVAMGDVPERSLDYLTLALDKRGVTAFDRRSPVDRNQAVSMTVDISLGLLTDEERERCIELGVFPEDAEVPLTAAGGVWRLDDFETEELIVRLNDLSLLKFDPKSGAFRIHDVMRSYFFTRLNDPSALHGRLADSWEDKRCLPDEYAWRWLAYHLKEAGRTGELHALLLDFDWIREKLRATDINALISDFGWTEEDQSLCLTKQTLILSAHVLAWDESQLAGQLLGRLMLFEGENKEIRSLLDTARKQKRPPWLRPLTPSLTPPGGPLIRTLAGHIAWVTSVAVSPDGKFALSASWDKTVKVWDVESGAELRSLEGHSAAVESVALSPDGKLALSASRDKTVKVWDVASGAELRSLEGHTDEVTSVAVSPDGKLALSASEDKTVKVWDVESGAELRSLEGHSAAVNSVALSPDGKLALSASRDKTVKVWDIASGAELRSLEGHASFVASVTVSSDGKLALSASGDRTVKVWDIASGAELRSLEGHAGKVFCVALSLDSKLALSASWDRTVKVWDVASGAELRSLEGHTDVVSSVALSPDGKFALSASWDKTVKVWDVASGAELRSLEGHAGEVNSVALSPDGKLALSASWDKTVKVWDVASGAELRSLEGHTGVVSFVALSPDGKFALSASWDKTVKVWDVASGAELRSLEGHAGEVNSVALSPDGKLALSASWDKTVKVWDVESGAELRSLEGHSAAVESVALSPDGKLALSASRDKTVKVWDIASGLTVASFEFEGAVQSCAIACDCRTFVAGDTASRVHFLRLEGF